MSISHARFCLKLSAKSVTMKYITGLGYNCKIIANGTQIYSENFIFITKHTSLMKEHNTITEFIV